MPRKNTPTMLDRLARDKEVIRRFSTGMSQTNIAEEIGLSITRIDGIICKYRDKLRQSLVDGFEAVRSKQINTIANMLAVQGPKALEGNRTSAKTVSALMDRKAMLPGAYATVKLDAKDNTPADTVDVLAVVFSGMPGLALPVGAGYAVIDIDTAGQDAAAASPRPPASLDLLVGVYRPRNSRSCLLGPPAKRKRQCQDTWSCRKAPSAGTGAVALIRWAVTSVVFSIWSSGGCPPAPAAQYSSTSCRRAAMGGCRLGRRAAYFRGFRCQVPGSGRQAGLFTLRLGLRRKDDAHREISTRLGI